MNYFEDENNIVSDNFNLEEILQFQLTHDVQIIRGRDYQYICYIDREAYCPSLTPMFALLFGIKQYKELNLG